tara:strand:- start:1471 stop:2070 length:600 start_codon:yes stop_codon:yes gene_type:complete
MNDSSGIFHLGAHRGVEAEVYNWFGKNVIWIEALPENFENLKENLYFYKNQKAFLALLSDRNDENKKFFVSNNDAACSSMFDFTDKIKTSEQWNKKDHKMINSYLLKTITLDKLLKDNKIDPKNYNHWVLDLQGAELLALKGAEESLKTCHSILIEVSKKQFYSGGVLWDELKKWLENRNFINTREPEKDEEDILFLKN